MFLLNYGPAQYWPTTLIKLMEWRGIIPMGKLRVRVYMRVGSGSNFWSVSGRVRVSFTGHVDKVAAIVLLPVTAPTLDPSASR